jgi:cytochrome c1
MMRNSLIITALLFLIVCNRTSFGENDLRFSEKDFSSETVERGKDIFKKHCITCHGLKYYRDTEYPSGMLPLIDPNSAQKSFGIQPPDLSLITAARGKRLNGMIYVYRLLTTYYKDDRGTLKNHAFAEETQGDGTIAMPQPIPASGPELKQKSKDVACFLLNVAEPSSGERKSLGKYVLGYMVLLTVLLYRINRKTWEGVKKSLF